MNLLDADWRRASADQWAVKSKRRQNIIEIPEQKLRCISETFQLKLNVGHQFSQNIMIIGWQLAFH